MEEKKITAKGGVSLYVTKGWVSLRVKRKVYRTVTVVKPALLGGLEMVPLTKGQEAKQGLGEVRML